MSMIANALMLPFQGLQGFAFGSGYGAGVRFGYEDVYPYLKKNMNDIAKMLNIPFVSSGFKLASGVTDAQGKGTGLEPAGGAPMQAMGLATPEQQRANVNASQFTFDAFTGETMQTSQWGAIPFANPKQVVNPFNGPSHYAVRDGKTINVYEKHGDRYALIGRGVEGL